LSAQRLFERLVTRGFKPPAGHRLLALSNGSKALQKVIKEQWPEALLQECLVPVERHVLDRLKRGHQGMPKLIAALKHDEPTTAKE
jgi:transposase-like protein